MSTTTDPRLRLLLPCTCGPTPEVSDALDCPAHHEAAARALTNLAREVERYSAWLRQEYDPDSWQRTITAVHDLDTFDPREAA